MSTPEAGKRAGAGAGAPAQLVVKAPYRVAIFLNRPFETSAQIPSRTLFAFPRPSGSGLRYYSHTEQYSSYWHRTGKYSRGTKSLRCRRAGVGRPLEENKRLAAAFS